MKEIWLPVKGYEGLYEVSNLGNVRSLNYHRTGQSKVLIPGENNRGYLYVVLCKSGKRKNFLVHRLVAENFLPNLGDGKEVNHRDENPKNNQVDNLEWCDGKYNCNFGTRIDRIREKRINGKFSKPVLQYTKTGELVREWASIMEAERNGFCGGNIIHCCRGRYKSHQGYIWKYKE